ncbi:unnamed protein product [Orchesella dallaii]|uniref:Beta,beta-carotene 15,15'-monooxygenase n=1 Tax=Orchesella dallaii TaxID=48710 RepID=A0ABP1QSJ4_9HEXA
MCYGCTCVHSLVYKSRWKKRKNVEHSVTHTLMSCFNPPCLKVTYSQKMLESEAYQRAVAARRPVYAEFGTRAYPDPNKGFLHRMFSTLVPTDLTDNNVTAMYRIENEVFAASETCFVHSINPETLDKKERVDFNKIAGTMFLSAHPLADADGTVWNIGSSMLTGCKYHVVKIKPTGSGKAADALKEAKVVATISSTWKTCMSYFHTFAMTENYIIFVEQPLLINCMKLAQIGIKGKALKDTFEWTPTEKNRIYIIEKDTGNVIKTKFITEDPCFVLHNINAFEREEQIVLDIIAYPNPSCLEKFTLTALRQNEFNNNDLSQTYRYVIPLVRFVVDITEDENLITIPEFEGSAVRRGDAVVLKPQSMAEPGLELPTINPRYTGRHHRFFYASGTFDTGYYKNAACKMDIETGKMALYKTGSRTEYCGEPTFIPKPDINTDEDDGVVLIPVSSGDITKPDYLAILDSKSFQELARAEFDTKFVQCLHGTFVPLL